MKISRRFLYLMFAVGAVVGCQTATDPNHTTRIVLGAPFNLQAGQTAATDDGALTLSFQRVAGDSRCPDGVTCIWEGFAELEFGAVAHQQSSPVVLRTLNSQFCCAADTVGNYTVQLVGLAPQAIHTNDPPPSYVVTLQVDAIN